MHKIRSLTLGARRRFVCRCWRCPRAAASPATPSCRLAARRSPRRRSNTGWRSPRRPSRVGRTDKPVIPEPPNYTACIAHLEEDRAEAAPKARSAPTTAELKTQCEQQYKSLQSEVLGFLISSQWVLREAESLGVKLTDAEVKKQFDKIKTEQFPKAAEFEKFLASSGPDGLGPAAAREAEHALAENPEEDRQGEAATSAKPRSKSTTTKTSPDSARRKSATCGSSSPKTEARRRSRQEGNRIGQELRERRQGKTRSTRPARPTAACSRKWSKARRRRRSTKPSSPPKPHELGGPVKTPFGYYVYEVVSIDARHPAAAGAGRRRRSKQQLIATSAAESAEHEFVKNFKTKWQAETECRSGYVVPDCKDYKAPKTHVEPAAPPPNSDRPTRGSDARELRPRRRASA